MTTTSLLRPGALEGRAVVAGGVYAAACEAAIVGADAARVDLLVVDAAPAFGDGGLDGLRAALDGAWSVVRAVAEAQWLTDGGGDDRGGGKLVLVAPRADAGEYFSGCRFGPR